MVSPRILVVDDEKLIRWTVRQLLEAEGYRIREAASVADAASRVAEGVDLVLLDVHLPDGNGLDLLKQLHADDPELLVIMLTGESHVDLVVRAMKDGAFHYLTKPVNNDELVLLVRNALETTRLRRELRAALSGPSEPTGTGLDLLVGRSPAVTRCKELLAKVATSPASTVLITGETGTGKDLAARVIHQVSDRAKAPFMHITCTALAETLFESELFGHERGAFTDARAQRRGLIEQANGGTLFLDEIGELTPALQAKLLRFLEDKTLRRVGGSADISVDVRVVAATNRDLQEMVESGSFREDLFFRLQVLPLELPPLRDRKGDVPLLAQHFVDHFCRAFHKTVRRIAPTTVDALEAHHWPGNVRELRNAIERAVLLSPDGGELSPDDLLLPRSLAARGEKLGKPDTSSVAASSTSTAASSTSESTADTAAGSGEFRLPEGGVELEHVERELVRQALERTNGNQTRAAALLGLNRDQIRYRIQKFDLGQVGKG